MKEWLAKIEKEIPVRFYRRQKRKALNWLCQEMEAMGYVCEKQEKRRYFSRVENLEAGNLKQAKLIFAIPYDTQSRIFWRQFRYYPLDGSKSANQSMFPIYAPIFILYFLMIGLLYGMPFLTKSVSILMASNAISIALLVILIVLLFKGFPSFHNSVYQNSAIASALALATRLNKEERKKVAFVFVDQNNGRYYGPAFLKERLSQVKRSTPIITLNCVGAGEHLVIGYTKGQKKPAQELLKIVGKQYHASIKSLEGNLLVQCAMGEYQKGMIIASGSDGEHGLVVSHLRRGKDRTADEEQLSVIVSMLEEYCKQL